MAYRRKFPVRVEAEQTDSPLGAEGIAGDVIEGLLVIPSSTSPGPVSLKDGDGVAETIFAGGDNSIPSLIPFPIWYPARSSAGGWFLTTGVDVAVVAFGRFTS